MHARYLLPLAFLPFAMLAIVHDGQEPVSQRIQPAFVPPLEGPPGTYHGKQKPWRLPREQPRQPRAVHAADWRGFDVREAFGLGAVLQEPAPAVGGAAQEPTPAVGEAAQEPVDASARREPPTLLDAIRAAPDAPSPLAAMRFGVTLDLYAAATEALDKSGAYNELRLRAARLDLEADVDRSTALVLSADLGDVADDGLLLREAAVVVGGLPGARGAEGWWLRAGRFYADLGAFNTVLPGSYAGPRIGAPAEDFLGGNLSLTGVAVHHDRPWSGGHFRWSAALASGSERHGWDAAVDGGPAPAPTGRTGADNLTATARLSAQFDAGAALSWRVGGSALYVPEEVAFVDDGAGGTLRQERSHALWGVDAGLLLRGAGARSHELAVELWLDDLEPLGGGDDPEAGATLLYHLQLDERWSGGLQLSRVDQARATAVDLRRSAQQAWLGYAFQTGNRLALFLTHENPGAGLEKFFTVGVEWTLDVGATRGAGIARWRASPVTAAASPGPPIARP